MRNLLLFAALFVVLLNPAHAANVMFEVTDQDGHAVADAVIAVTSNTETSPEQAAQQITIDQRNETFIPFVSILPRGGSVIFNNSDRVRHHVYSFAPIKQFQFILNPGESSEPIKFDKAGVAAIGCNIHDKMVTYVYVTDTKWTALTRSDGSGVIASLPKGEYTATVWHPRLKPGTAAPSQAVSVGAQPVNIPMTVSLVAPARSTGHHGSSY